MKEIKVCLVSDTVYDVNGVSRFIQDFAKEAKVFKKDFVVLSSTNKKHYEKIDNIKNIKPVFSIKMPFYKSLDLVFPNFFKIKKELKELKPDLLCISTPGTVGLCALVCAKLLKIPLIGIYHTDFPSYMYKNTKSKFVKKVTQAFLKLFYKDFKALFSRSSEYLEVIQKDLGFKKRDLYLIKHGIDIKKFDRKFKDETIWQEYKVNKNFFKVLYVGRVSVEKNIDILIDIWTKEHFKDASLVLVGDDEIGLDKKSLEKQNIFLLGRKQKEELSKLYASGDCFVFPSTTDTLGQVVMEAMSSGLPVIVTNKGGPKTFVNEKMGFILDIKKGRTLIKALKTLQKKDEVYIKKSEEAYAYMRDKSISHSFLKFWEDCERI